MEEEQENKERGGGQRQNHDETPEDEALEEMHMHACMYTLPLAAERERLLIRVKKPKLMDYEEME